VKKRLLLELLEHVKDDEEIKIVVDEAVDSGTIDGGDILDVRDVKFDARVGHLIRTYID
jgi:hypothetical protein